MATEEEPMRARTGHRRNAMLILPAVILFGFALLTPAVSAAGGGPIVPAVANGEIGITSPAGGSRYVTFDGERGTIVARIEVGSGVVRARRLLERNGDRFGIPQYGIPQVAFDGSPAGLSADGSTLVLTRAFGPVDRGELLVLDTDRLTVQRRIILEGQFSFDAISPDGRRAYVVEYPRRFDYSVYRVRELDLESGRLTPGVIADVDVGEEPEGPMRGTALTRADSADGRWAYTLYDGGGGVPFIHALDTIAGEAVCIFLEQLQSLTGSRRINDLSLFAGDAQPALAVAEGAAWTAIGGPEPGTGETLVTVDTETFAINEPAAAADRSPATASADDGGGIPLVPLLAALFIAGGIAVLVRGVRRRRGGGSGSAGPAAASSR